MPMRGSFVALFGVVLGSDEQAPPPDDIRIRLERYSPTPYPSPTSITTRQ